MAKTKTKPKLKTGGVSIPAHEFDENEVLEEHAAAASAPGRKRGSFVLLSASDPLKIGLPGFMKTAVMDNRRLPINNKLMPTKPKSDLKISEMRNLGPAVEKDLNAVGIYLAREVIKLGPEKAFLKMLEGRMKIGRSAKCCNALYLYSFYGAINDVDWRKVPAKKKAEYIALTKKLRDSGKYR